MSSAQVTGISAPPDALPSLEMLCKASREELLRCLEILEEFNKQGRRPPDGYLFALSQEVGRLQRAK